jgi:hypothetical protein
VRGALAQFGLMFPSGRLECVLMVDELGTKSGVCMYLPELDRSVRSKVRVSVPSEGITAIGALGSNYVD